MGNRSFMYNHNSFYRRECEFTFTNFIRGDFQLIGVETYRGNSCGAASLSSILMSGLMGLKLLEVMTAVDRLNSSTISERYER